MIAGWPESCDLTVNWPEWECPQLTTSMQPLQTVAMLPHNDSEIALHNVTEQGVSVELSH